LQFNPEYENMSTGIKQAMLGEVLRKWRYSQELDLRTVSAQIGIAPATLMRIEQGRSFDALTMVMLLEWLMGRKKKAA
jgi:transcriptional regulator with XRE-family HTH domain